METLNAQRPTSNAQLSTKASEAKRSLNSQLSASPARTGWGHTRGWSKKLHYFEGGRAHCSGSTQREGETLITNHQSPITSGPFCTDCLNHVNAGKNKNNQRGVARINGRAVPSFA